MAKSYIDSLDILLEYENRFLDDLSNNPIEILREIKVSRGDIDNIAKHINVLFRSNNKGFLKERFPVTVSLFLVWCTVYEYRDGEMWANIFSKLKIPSSHNNMRFFGDVFLKVLNNHELIQIKEGEGKKYLSPILMHGYISNNYAYDLFDYLNKIYSIILEEDISDESIDTIWNDIFSENIKEEKEILEKKRQELLEELNLYYQIDDEIKNIDHKDVKKLELEVKELENIISLHEKQVDIINGKINNKQNLNTCVKELGLSMERLSEISKDDFNISNLKEINTLLDEVNCLIKSKKQCLKNQKRSIIKEIKGLNNKLAVKKERLLSIKTKISTLGQGNLNYGWLEIEAYKEKKEQLKSIELEIQKNKKLQNIELEENTTLKQVLTASLHNLRISNPEHFKSFMVKTIQMMGSYFLGKEIDMDHPLYEIFLEWANRTPEISEYNETTKPQTINIKGNKGKRLLLQSMKKPYIKFDTNRYFLNIIIPEQNFYFNENIDIEPNYTLLDKLGREVKLDVDHIYHNQKIYIKEIKIPIDTDSYEYMLFRWYNLKESHDISLDKIMLFDESGNLLNKNKLKNGYYYLICDKSLKLDENIVVNENKVLLENYKIYEIYLNETKLTIYSQENKAIMDIIATNHDISHLERYNPIEGIYVDDIAVTTGPIPELIVNYIDIDTSEVYLNIFIDDHLIFKDNLYKIMKSHHGISDNSMIKLDIHKLLKLGKYTTAYKFKILLNNIEEETLLEEEFYYLPRTKFTYTSAGLKVKIGRGMRILNKDYQQQGTEYLISLENKEGENFSIYYDRHGWIKFWVEVPSVDIRIFYRLGEEYKKDYILYGSKREEIKDLFIECKTESQRIKSILLFDKNKHLESSLHLKDGKVRTSLEPYFDILSVENRGQLLYKIEDKYISMKEKVLLETYDKWEISNIKVHQKEGKDEYILGIDYDENFAFKGVKYIEVINDNRVIVKKSIKDQIYIYIKKKDLGSNYIVIIIGYEDQYESVFGKMRDDIIVGTVDIKLKSVIDKIEKILKNGISAVEFGYQGKAYSFKYPIDLYPIYKAHSKNFEGEEIYTTNILSNGKNQDIYFYINTDKNILPFLIDNEFDGAQYDPDTGRVFWEYSSNKNIMGPIENIRYVMKEEK